MSGTRTASLDDIRRMKAAGEVTALAKTATSEDMPEGFWDTAEVKLPQAKEPLSLRVDPDILEFFKEGGAKGYQTRIHAVLRAYVDAKRG